MSSGLKGEKRPRDTNQLGKLMVDIVEPNTIQSLSLR
jgi:hypothetical protein